MKRIFKYLLIALIGLPAHSCREFFEQPTNTRDLEYVFNNGNETMAWLSRAFGYLPDPMVAWRSAWNEYFPYVVMADECDAGIDSEEIKAYRINLGDWNSSESGFGGKWDIYYQQLRHLYIFLDNVHYVPSQNYIDSEAKVERLRLEARLLIAYYHVLLFEQFGPIPIIKGLADLGTPLEELKVSRNSVDEVVEWLDAELLTVANALPENDTETVSWIGRPLKGAALAIRARLLLYAASPLFNSPDNYAGHEEFRSLANADGKKLFPQSYDPTKWAAAAAAAKLVMEIPRYQLHETTDKTGDAFVDGYRSYREIFTEPGNSEVIFARTMCDFNEYLQGIQPRQWQAGGFLAVTQKLVDAFYMQDGTYPEDDPTYLTDVNLGFTTDRNQITVNRLVQERAKIDRVYNMYQNREARFYASVFFNGRKWESQHAEVGGTVEPVEFYIDGKSGRPNHDSPKSGYTSYKYVDADDYKYRTQAKNPVLFRLAGVYLDYIEALNHSDPGNTDILLYLNKIRNRAGLADWEDVYPDKTSAEDIHEAIMRERQVEMNWEGTRYFDTRRYFLAETEDAGDFYGMNTQGSLATYYRRTVFEKRVFKPSFYLFPIPQWEIEKNGNLVQNPYWN
jgi:hypothetical protein